MALLCAILVVVIFAIVHELLPKLREDYAKAKANSGTSAVSQEKFKKTITKIVISIVAIVVAATLMIVCFVNIEPSRSSNSSKGKCAMCGRTTSLTGSFCSSCNDKAFGNDGWYDKIKD